MKSMGIILAGGRNERLGNLTELRASSAMPVGGSFRAIDFSLSNMVSSGISKVAVITQFNSRSLNDHLSSSKWWDFGAKKGGLFTFSPFLSNDSSLWFRGTADSIYQNLTFLQRSNETHVVIAAGEGIYKMDYSAAIRYHVKKKADITIICKDVGHLNVQDYGVLELDENERMLDFEEKPVEPTSSLISLGIYVISRTLLIQLLETILAEGRYDFVKDIIIRYRKKLNMYGYKFDGYWSTINCIESYFDTNMDFLRPEVRRMFFKEKPFIDTKQKDEPPVKYNISSESKDCLIGSGSILNGYCEHSVLFRRVFTGENTSIRNAIIMEGCYIGNNCVIEHAILDKEVVVSDGKHIIGQPGKPVIIKKGTVL